MPERMVSRSMVDGTKGYDCNPEDLVRQYESVTFADVHRNTLHLFPKQASRVLDIGAGSGRDAAALTTMGHRVAAVEPTPELRYLAQRLHPHPSIRWIDDSLPELSQVFTLNERFDLILLTAVWMHLDATERHIAMERLARLIAPSGRVILSIRRGPIPVGRRMFDVSPQEIPELAAQSGLEVIYASQHEDRLGRRDVSWMAFALALAEPAAPREAEADTRLENDHSSDAAILSARMRSVVISSGAV